METINKRFASKYSIDSVTDCWNWIGRKKKGYGRIKMILENGTSVTAAHRVSYFIHKGDIGPFFVCHTCDNKICVNPAHLFLGTQSDNMVDCVEKNRHYGARIFACPQGHLYTEENTYTNPNRGAKGRTCRICKYESNLNRLSKIHYEKGCKKSFKGFPISSDWTEVTCRRCLEQIRTHCRKGHLMNEQNTYFYSRSNGTTQKFCRECQRIVDKNYRENN